MSEFTPMPGSEHNAYDDEVYEIEYFTEPHCDHCDSGFVEGIGVILVDGCYWCLPCADAEGYEYKEWDQ